MADILNENRPEPEAFLNQAKKEGRGQLKIFMGSAPGVGKTYAMLQAAHRRKAENKDIVVGIVETHGRKETEMLLQGLEVLPRRVLTYRGKAFQEMDIDAILRRKPEIVLVDELAHTNVEGSRHAKRWQDVEEILASGINVYSTLNIQHLESLNDIVQRITWVKIREKVPDSVLKMADEIELIDLPPDELIQRLREGKVYMPEQAQMAIRHYFSKGNLTALRELAMRTAAEHVDTDMISYMKTHGVSGPWPARERLIVCIDENSGADDLIRVASRMAARLKVPWIALHVESITDVLFSEKERENIDSALRLTEELDGEAVTIRGGTNIADDILAFARSRNATRLLIGRSNRLPITEAFLPSVSRQLVIKAKDFDLTILHTTSTDKNQSSILRFAQGIIGAPTVKEFGLSTLVVLAALALAYVVRTIAPVANLSLIFLMPVLYAGVRYGLLQSIYTVFVGLAAYNFFLTEPRFDFKVYSTHDLGTLLFFLFVAIITGNMAIRLKNQIKALRLSARRNAQMHDFSRKLAVALTLDDILQESVISISMDLRLKTVILLPEPGTMQKLYVAAHHPATGCDLNRTDWAAGEWAWKNKKPAGAGSDTLPAAHWYFIPLKGPKETIAVLGVTGPTKQETEEFELNPSQKRMLNSFCDQTALAIDRAKMAENIEDARLGAETERLRSAMLSSISQDLRAPLVAMMQGTRRIIQAGDHITLAERQDMLREVVTHGERLNRFIQNLLDMTKLGVGGFQPKSEWVGLQELLDQARKRLDHELSGYNVQVHIDPEVAQINIDPVMMEQVLVNILENCTLYAPAGTAIFIDAVRENKKFILRIADQGPGIPEKERKLVFDMFYRVRAQAEDQAGVGLGLAICRGLIEAQNGEILAQDGPDDKGTAIVIAFPPAVARPVGSAGHVSPSV